MVVSEIGSHDEKLEKQPASAVEATPNFKLRNVILLLTCYMVVGAVVFFLIRDQLDGKKTNAIIDSIYFCVVTMTTVGYGDLLPHSALAKILACVYVFFGMALVGVMLSSAASYIAEKQGNVLVRAMHSTKKKSYSAEMLTEIYKVKYKLLLNSLSLLVLMTVGISFLILVEGMEVIDAFYCVCCSITTLGYGDKSFSTLTGRVFAILWILSSTVCLAQFFLILAELHTETRQRSLVDWALNRRLTRADLKAADLDQDEVVSAAEFILYKLKEMGKISQEDILVLMERFRVLDVDQSGTLTEKDLILS